MEIRNTHPVAAEKAEAAAPSSARSAFWCALAAVRLLEQSAPERPFLARTAGA